MKKYYLFILYLDGSEKLYRFEDNGESVKKLTYLYNNEKDIALEITISDEDFNIIDPANIKKVYEAQIFHGIKFDFIRQTFNTEEEMNTWLLKMQPMMDGKPLYTREYYYIKCNDTNKYNWF